MRTRITIGALVLLFVPTVYAAIVTNTNQSVLFFRFPARNASTVLDAVYYNPAGLMKLQDGFHLAVHNQTLLQDRTINNTLRSLNNPEYLGKVKAPIYPNLYAVYKKGDFALSFGFEPIAGGGSAKYDTGLPSFESQMSLLPLLLSNAQPIGIPTTKYSAEINFEGSSIFYGFQVNASFALSDMISAAAGVRYVYAVNTYEGSLKNIQINPTFPALGWTGQMRSASAAFGTLYAATGNPAFQASAAATSDKAVDVKQVGSGFTPLLGLHLTPANNLNIGIRYEFNTKIESENQTTKDDLGAYPDGKKERNDIPAVLSLGAEYGLSPSVRAAVSYTLCFEKNANWAGREKLLDSNSTDLGFAIEFDVTKSITLSGGYITTKTGAGAMYQLDTSFDLSSNTFGAGARIRISPKVELDLGAIYVKYKNQDKPLTSPYFGAYTETYKQKSLGFGFGLNFHL